MRFYLPLLAGERDVRGLTYSPSTERKPVSPWPKGRWSTTYDLVYMASSSSGRFDEATKRELPKLIALINPQVEELPDIIGEFSFAMASPPPLVSDRLHDLMEELSPGCCEYLEAPEIWDIVFHREIDRKAYRFANMIKQVDSWDHNLSDIREMQRRDGSIWHSLGGVGTVDAQKAKGHNLWRDSVTKHVLCSEEFKRRVESIGISNFFFFEQITSNLG